MNTKPIALQIESLTPLEKSELKINDHISSEEILAAFNRMQSVFIVYGYRLHMCGNIKDPSSCGFLLIHNGGLEPDYAEFSLMYRDAMANALDLNCVGYPVRGGVGNSVVYQLNYGFESIYCEFLATEEAVIKILEQQR